MLGRATIRDVAKLAGVSTATVSYVLNNSHPVRQQTKLNVHAAAKSVCYTPNLHARNLATRHNRLLGLIISDIADPFFSELLKSIHNRALELGNEVIMKSANHESRKMESTAKHLLGCRVEGVIVMISEQDEVAKPHLCLAGVSTVYLDLRKTETSITDVRVNYERGVREAVEHLVALGHRRIAFLSAREASESSRLQLAYIKATESIGSGRNAISYTFQGCSNGERRTELILSSLRQGPRPTAIIADNDLTAAALLSDLKREGFRVPEDISLIGHDDTFVATLTDPLLTTIAVPRAEVGRIAVDAVLGRGQGLGRNQGALEVNTRLIVRASTGPSPD